jgi:hypothetical protein
MRGKLKDAALLKATEGLFTLRDVFQFCERSQSYRDTCSTAPEFWKKTIEKCLGNIVVLQRGDIEESGKWYDFARLLITGVEYSYCLIQDDNGDFETQVQPYSAVDEIEADHTFHEIRIRASLPEAGTQGFLIRVYSEPPFEYEGITFFVHSDQTIAQTRASRYVGEQFHTRSYFRNRGGRSLMEIGDNPEFELDAFPESSFFVDTVRETLAGGANEGWWNMKWIDENGEDKAIYFSWDIVPITF